MRVNSSLARSTSRIPRAALRCAAAAAAACFALLSAGPAWSLDGDGDGVDDATDDCVAVANPNQLDTDHDGYGNACDSDFDEDGTVGFSDLAAVQKAFGARVGSAQYSEALDLDGDGAIGTKELLAVQRRIGSAPGPSGLACAGTVPCGSGGLALKGAEEVLSKAVRLTFDPVERTHVVAIERRLAGGSWETAGMRLGGSDFVDRGPLAQGLAPGTYEFRIQVDGATSSPRSVTLREECAGQPATSAQLPVVEITDRDRDGDYDGDDVRAALAACSQLRGCILRALPVVYSDVNIELAAATGYTFPNGLVIEGYGSATVFRSRIFSMRDHNAALCPAGTPAPCYQPQPVLGVTQPGVTTLDGVRFRNFQIDGRKREQPDPGTPENTWGQWGISAVVPWTPVITRDGCIHNVRAHDLLTGGFAVQHTVAWIIEQSTVEDVGCQDDLTPCPGLVRTPEYLTIPGVRATGFGIVAGIVTDLTVARDNHVVRATKYGMGSVWTDSRRAYFHDNLIESGGGAGIQCNSCQGLTVERNLIRSMHYPTGRNSSWPNGFTGELAQGINCTGPARDIAIRNNVVSNGDGSGIRLQCAGPNVVAEGNAIIDNCRKYGQSLVIAQSDGTIARNNQVQDSSNGCSYSVMVYGARNAVLDGGGVESGPATHAGILVVGTSQNPTRNLLLRHLRLDARGSRGVGVQLVSPTSGTTVYSSVCNDGFPTRVADASSGGTRLLNDTTGCAP